MIECYIYTVNLVTSMRPAFKGLNGGGSVGIIEGKTWLQFQRSGLVRENRRGFAL